MMYYYTVSRRWFSKFEIFLAGFFSHTIVIEAFYTKNYPLAIFLTVGVIFILLTHRKEYKNVT